MGAAGAVMQRGLYAHAVNSRQHLLFLGLQGKLPLHGCLASWQPSNQHLLRRVLLRLAKGLGLPPPRTFRQHA